MKSTEKPISPRSIDFTVETFVVFRNRVLLRKHDKYGIWLSVGGHIEPDEDPNQAAVREVREEVGLEVELLGGTDASGLSDDGHRDLAPPRFLNRHPISDRHEHVTLVFFATAASDVIGGEAAADGAPECRWFSREEVASSPDLAPWLKVYALAALDAIADG